MSEITGAAFTLALLALAAVFVSLRRYRGRVSDPAELAALCDAVLHIDAQGQLVSIEAGRAESHPWPSDATRWQDLIHEEDHPRVDEALADPSRRSVTPVRVRSRDEAWHRGLVLWRPVGRNRLCGYFRAYDPDPSGPSPLGGAAPTPFVSAVTHQLNNRLHLVRGFAEIVQHAQLGGRKSAEIDRIQEAIDESAELLQRLSALTTEPHAAPLSLDVADELARLVTFAEPILGGRTKLRLEGPEEPLRVLASPETLLQGGTALLLHAAAQQGRGGVIRLRGRRLDETEIAIDVLGEPRPREDPEPEAEPALALALDRLETCGGRIELELVEGAQRLRVVLPSSTPPGTGQAAPDTGEARHVLVVDASDHERALLCEMLEEEGFRSWEAANGREALAIAESLPPLTLLIVDLLLEAETGAEVRDQLRARQPGVRALFTTSFPEVLGVRAEPDDAPATLAKPYKREELVRLLESALDD